MYVCSSKPYFLKSFACHRTTKFGSDYDLLSLLAGHALEGAAGGAWRVGVTIPGRDVEEEDQSKVGYVCGAMCLWSNEAQVLLIVGLWDM